MKKTLAAVAVLGAFAGSTLAADVTLYGRIDTGFQLNDWEKTTAADVTTDGTDFGMKSGLSTTSRVGIKGSEEISEGLTVGFNLETKLLSDTGKSFDGGFDRESVLWAKTDFGTVYAGKVGSIWSDGGATNFWAGNYVAFGTGAGGDMAMGASLLVSQGREANRLSYKSPTIGGFTAYAEYSFGTSDTAENNSSEDRPAAIGLDYHNGAFGAGLVVSYKNEKSWIAKTDASVIVGKDGKPTVEPGEAAHHEEQEDEWTVSLGTAYDFGVAKVMLAGQYFTGADKVGFFDDNLLAKDTYDDLEGYGVVFGADVPMAGGNWTLGVAYTDGEDKAKNSKVEFKGYNAAAMYYYPLSKRTKVYAGAGYTKLEGDGSIDKAEYESTKAVMGMAHYF